MRHGYLVAIPLQTLMYKRSMEASVERFIWSLDLKKFLFFWGVVACTFGTVLSPVSSEEPPAAKKSDSKLSGHVFSDLRPSEPDATATIPIDSSSASVQATHHKVALFSGLDKITGRNVSFEVAAGEKVQFGGLYLTSTVCMTRMRNDTPEDEAFVQIWEVQKKKAPPKSVFSGWMLASSPGLNTLEHPIYAIWLLQCR